MTAELTLPKTKGRTMDAIGQVDGGRRRTRALTRLALTMVPRPPAAPAPQPHSGQVSHVRQPDAGAETDRCSGPAVAYGLISTRPTRPSVLHEYSRFSAWFNAPVVGRPPAATGPLVERLRDTTSLQGRQTVLSGQGQRTAVPSSSGRSKRRTPSEGNRRIPIRPRCSGCELRFGEAVTAFVDLPAPEGLRCLDLRNESRISMTRSAAMRRRMRAFRVSTIKRRTPQIPTSRSSMAVLGSSHALYAQDLAPPAALDERPSPSPLLCTPISRAAIRFDVLDLHVGDFGPVWSPPKSLPPRSEPSRRAIGGAPSPYG